MQKHRTIWSLTFAPLELLIGSSKICIVDSTTNTDGDGVVVCTSCSDSYPYVARHRALHMALCWWAKKRLLFLVLGRFRLG